MSKFISKILWSSGEYRKYIKTVIALHLKISSYPNIRYFPDYHIDTDDSGAFYLWSSLFGWTEVHQKSPLLSKKSSAIDMIILWVYYMRFILKLLSSFCSFPRYPPTNLLQKELDHTFRGKWEVGTRWDERTSLPIGLEREWREARKDVSSLTISPIHDGWHMADHHHSWPADQAGLWYL